VKRQARSTRHRPIVCRSVIERLTM